jgi:hypothetical protein
MFRLEIFVDDKKLSYVLWALSGHVIEVKTPQPVQNAKVKNGSVRAETSGDRVEMLMKHLADQGLKEFGPSVAAAWSESVGLARSTYSNVLNKALRAKVITRRRPKGSGKGSGAKFIYTVVGGK